MRVCTLQRWKLHQRIFSEVCILCSTMPVKELHRGLILLCFKSPSMAVRMDLLVHVQDVLWARLGEAMQQLHASAVAVWHLQRVLAKKRDPLSHDLFIDVVQLPAAPDAASPPLPCDRFWCVTLGFINSSD